MELHVKKLSAQATLPTYAHATDAGMDVYASTNIAISAGQRALVPTGIALAIPEGYVGLVWDKSGLATKTGIITLAGVIDSGYRGEIQIAIYNTSSEKYTVNAGQKIAQLLIQPIVQPKLIEVDELIDSERGEGGFGSTGL